MVQLIGNGIIYRQVWDPFGLDHRRQTVVCRTIVFFTQQNRTKNLFGRIQTAFAVHIKSDIINGCPVHTRKH